MNTERFFEFATKACAGQCTDAERAELESMLASEPELRVELKRMQADARLAREVLPLLEASESSSEEFPAYARERLQTKVRQTLAGRKASTEPAGETERKMMWRWRWVLGLASATALAAFLMLTLVNRPSEPVIQVAMLDTAGATRGFDTNEAALLRQTWEKVTVDSFSNVEDLRAWEAKLRAQVKSRAVKVVFDRAAGEVRISGRWKGRSFEKAFLIEQDLATTLQQADAFIKENTSR